MNGLFKKLNESKVFKDLSPQEFSWVLYDVGNSAFTMLGCSLIPIWFKSLAIGTEAGKISSDNATAYWALATSIVTVIVALITRIPRRSSSPLPSQSASSAVSSMALSAAGSSS